MATRRGLTVLETVMALGLLAAMLLGLMAFFTNILAATAKQDDLTAGVVFAQKQLDKAILEGTYANSTAAVQEGLYTHDTANQTSYFYKLTSTPVPLPPPATASAYWLEAQVWWWSTGPAQNRGRVGMLSTRLAQLVTPP